MTVLKPILPGSVIALRPLFEGVLNESMYWKSKLAILVLLLAVVPAAFVMAGPAAKPDNPEPASEIKASIDKAPQALFPQMTFKFDPVFEGKEIAHDFVVENKGRAPLVIKSIRPD